MRKIFLDCGANTGISVDMFRAKFPQANEYKIYSFEANPHIAKRFKREGVIFIHKAVWIEDGTIPFFMGKSKTSVASSVYGHKKTGGLSRIPVDVPCLDFHKWLISHFTKDDHVVLKLDIEGAEYEVLQRMFDLGSIALVKQLFVDWHYEKIDFPKKKHDNIIGRLRSVGLTPLGWDAEKGTFGSINLAQ